MDDNAEVFQFPSSSDSSDEDNSLASNGEVVTIEQEICQVLLEAIADGTDPLDSLEDFYKTFKCTKLNFTHFMELEDPVLALEVLKKFVYEGAPDIKEFGIYKHAPTYALEAKMWKEIAKLENLEKIKMSGCFFSLNDLMDMCKGLPKLLELEVILDYDSSYDQLENKNDFARRCIESFGQLKTIEYDLKFDLQGNEDDGEIYAFQKELTNRLILNLRNICIATCTEFESDMSQACRELNRISKLKHLERQIDDIEEDENLNFDKLPEVECLYLSSVSSWKEDQDICAIIKKLRVFRLKELRVFNLTVTDHLPIFLSTWKETLEKVYLDYDKNDYDGSVIDLHVLFEFCPTLVHICIVDANVDSSIPLAAYSGLKNVEIRFKSGVERNFPLLNFLQAPNLREVDLENLSVTAEELESTIESIRNESILLKIEYICLTIEPNVREKLQSFKEDFIAAVKGLRQNDINVVEFN